MTESDLSWKSLDGINFFAHTWRPDGEVKAAITLVHGFGEHCLRYTHYFKYFTEQGIAILGFDLRGHGQSGGKRGAIKSYDALIDDIETEIRRKDSTEIKSKDVGNIVMKYLRKLDNVAYIRFASVYREFTDVESFEEELHKLLKKQKNRK